MRKWGEALPLLLLLPPPVQFSQVIFLFFLALRITQCTAWGGPGECPLQMGSRLD